MILSHLRYAATFLSLTALTLQQELETCQSQQTNATGTISFPGFTPPGVDPNTWYLSTTFTDIRHANNNSVDQMQRFYTSFPASQNFSDPSTGIDGCVIFYSRRGAESEGEGDWSTTCENVLESDCQAHLLESAQNVARSAVGQGVSGERRCGNLLLAMSGDQCEDDAEETTQSFSGTLPRNGTCLGSPVGGTSIPADFHSSTLPSIGAGRDAFDKYDVYDQFIKQATPVLYVAWGTAEDSSYTDARLMCITPDMIVEGSRSAAMQAKGVGSWSCVAVALFAAMISL